MNYFLILILFLTLSVSAEDPRKDKDHPCTPDIPLFCKDVIPVHKENWSCLGNKIHMLSPRCKSFMEKIYVETNPCGKDVLTFCPGSKSTYINWPLCIVKRKSEISNKCRNYLTILRPKLKDRLSFICAEENAKCVDNDAEKCLERITKSKDLSGRCKDAVELFLAL